MPYSKNTLVCINPDTTFSVFLSIFFIRIQLALELYTLPRINTSDRNKTKVHIQLNYILGLIVHGNNMDR